MERWRDIPGYEGIYQVSDFGRVRSRYRRGRYSWTQVTDSWRLLKPGREGNGYLYVALSLGGERKNRSVHTLVAEAFLGPRPAGMQVCHADGSTDNNRLENLRYDTPAGNQADCRKRRGRKLQREDVLDIRFRAGDGERVPDIAGRYGITPKAVYNVLGGKAWGRV